MGNTSTTNRMSNHSKRNVRLFVTNEALEFDAFITARPVDDDVCANVRKRLPGSKKFRFRTDVRCVRVLASQSQQFHWETQQFLSIFVEDEDDENICSKQITQNMALSAPVTVLLYDV